MQCHEWGKPIMFSQNFRQLLLCGTGILACLAPLGFAEVIVAQARIVVSDDAPPAVRHAAAELQYFLSEMSGASLAIVSDSAPPSENELVVGPGARLTQFSAGIDRAALGEEGYVLRGNGSRLFIVGGEPRGTLYGVYGLLEDHLGCRWFIPEVSHLPHSPDLRIPTLDESVIPALEYREVYLKDCFDGDWAARNRLNGHAAELDERHGGKIIYEGFVHTFLDLVPPEQYFDAHPEYFSLVNGKRQRDRAQLCCTNEDVIRVVTEEVMRRMRARPEARVFSVSTNDWWGHCECDACMALADAEESLMAPVLLLVNRVANAVADVFPEKRIDTIAYQWTRKPPKTLRPAENVIIRLCSIECCFAHPFDQCDSPQNQAFVEDVVGWSKIAKHLWVWDYMTSFDHFLLPFPNLRVRDDNIRFLAAHNVTGIFEQDNSASLNGELSALGGYMTAKFLWNPGYDQETAMGEFLDAVYGPAAGPIRAYIDLLHNKVEAENIHIGIREGPEAAYLTEELLARADALWDEAERAVAGQSVHTPQDRRDHVHCARLSVDYAILERARGQGASLFLAEGDHVRIDPVFERRARRFLDSAEACGVTQLAEINGAFAAYKPQLESLLAVAGSTPLPAAEGLSVDSGLRYSVFEGSWYQLPDFDLLSPVAEGVTTEVSIEVTDRRDLFGIRFTGFLRVPTTGVYFFHLKSNDGSRLYLDRSLLIDNDGLHGPIPRTAATRLAAGLHEIQIDYFESAGSEGIELALEGPDRPKQVVRGEELWHVREG